MKNHININEFKDWLDKNSPTDFFLGHRVEDPNDKYVGKTARTKVGKEKLIERVQTEDDPVTVVQEFIDNGGIVVQVEEKMVHIELENSEISLPRFCVKIHK